MKRINQIENDLNNANAQLEVNSEKLEKANKKTSDVGPKQIKPLQKPSKTNLIE